MKNSTIEAQWYLLLKNLAEPQKRKCKHIRYWGPLPEQEVFAECTCVCVLFLPCGNIAPDFPEVATAGHGTMFSL